MRICWIILILILAIFLRTYDIGRVFLHTTDVRTPADIKFLYPHSVEDINPLSQDKRFPSALNLLVGSHNILVNILGFLIATSHILVNKPITEVSWNLPIALLNVFSLVILYFFVKKISNSNAALVSLLLLSLIPIHIASSRSLSLDFHYFEMIFQLLTFYIFIIFLERGGSIYCWLFSISLMLYIISGIFVPFIFLPLLFIFWVFYKNQNQTLYGCIKRYFIRWPIIIISLSGVFLVTVPTMVNYLKRGELIGVLGNIGNQTATKGVYLLDYLKTTVATIHWIGLIMIIISFLLFYFYIRERKVIICSYQNLPLVAGVSYSIPFLFLIQRPAYTIVGGMFAAQWSLLVFSAIMLSNTNKMLWLRSFSIKMLKYSLITSCSLIYLVGSLNYLFEIADYPIFHVGAEGGFFVSKFPFKYGKGIKTVAYWVMENSNTDTRVYSNMFALAGMQPIYYYLNRQIIMRNGKMEDAKAYYDHAKNKVGVLIISPLDYYDHEQFTKDGFNLAVKVLYKNEINLLVYTKKMSAEPKIVLAMEYDKEYDKKYALPKQLFSCRCCIPRFMYKSNN